MAFHHLQLTTGTNYHVMYDSLHWENPMKVYVFIGRGCLYLSSTCWKVKGYVNLCNMWVCRNIRNINEFLCLVDSFSTCPEWSKFFVRPPERAACPAPAIGLLMQMNEGAVAIVSEATCIYVCVISHYSICRYGAESNEKYKSYSSTQNKAGDKVGINITVCYVHFVYYILCQDGEKQSLVRISTSFPSAGCYNMHAEEPHRKRP